MQNALLSLDNGSRTRPHTANRLSEMMPAPQASSAQLPAPQPQAKPNPWGNALKGFASGFLGPDKTRAMDQNFADDKQKKAKAALIWMQQTAQLPAEQRAQFTLRNAQTIASETGQPYERIIASAQDPNGFSDDAMKGAIAQFSAMAGVAPDIPEKMSEYQAAQIAQQEAQAKQPKPFSTNNGIVVWDPESAKATLAYDTTPDEKPPWVGAVKNAQGQWEFDPNYIKGYRQMHPQSPSSSGNAPPSGYRWVAGADGQPALEKIPGGPADKPEIEYTPGQKAKFTQQATALNSIEFAADEYRNAVKKFGTRLIANPNDPNTAELEAAHTNLMMVLKSPEMFALGVLTGPDLDILEKSVTPPTGFKSFGANSETISRRLDVLNRFLAQKRGQIPEEIVDKVGSGKEAPQAGPAGIMRGISDAVKGAVGGEQPTETDISPDIEALLDDALGPDEEDAPEGWDPEDWQYLTPEEKREALGQ